MPEENDAGEEVRECHHHYHPKKHHLQSSEQKICLWKGGGRARALKPANRFLEALDKDGKSDAAAGDSCFCQNKVIIKVKIFI